MIYERGLIFKKISTMIVTMQALEAHGTGVTKILKANLLININIYGVMTSMIV